MTRTGSRSLCWLVCFALSMLGLLAQDVGVTGADTINQCETKTYTISIQNDSGNPLTDLVVTARLGNLTGFSYVAGTAAIDVEGNPICNGAGDDAEPVVSGTDLIWNIDTRCPNNSPFTLNDGQTINIAFDLATDCSAVSGSLNVRFDYEISGTPMSDETGAHSIQVMPGGVTIKKAPNVIPQYVGQDVTWTLTVENSGFGTIKNVVVADVLDSGLSYVSSSPAGSNAGQTTTWGSTEIPDFALMNPGDKVTIDITATVIACQNLENSADVRWGCDLVTDCYNTADTVPPSTADAAVERIPRSPLLDYTPPDVSFSYCEDQKNVSFTITNIGDGSAYDIRLLVDFGALTVSNVSAGATYNDTQHRFELANPILPSGTYDLSYTLNYSAWCGSTFPAGELLWQDVYLDECGNEFYPPIKLSSVNPPADAASVSLSKVGGGEAIQIGDQIAYNVTSSYSGPLSCGSGSVSDIKVVDTVPAGFSVLDAGGGTWVPGGGGTGGTITWTYIPPAFLNTNITLQAPDRSQCETYCFTTFSNSVSASGTDCCGCSLSASASQTTAIECEELVDSNKTANPGTQERCNTIEYTNIYDFADAGILLNTLTFTEHAENQQQYVPGSLAVTYDGADITGCVLVTDTTPGGNLSLDFSGCAADIVNNKNLTIVYRLTITEATVAACSGSTFYSWSTLDMGITGSECLQDGEILETTAVTVEPPAMSVVISGLGQIVDKCQTHTITLTLTQTSSVANPKDVRLVLSGLNYYVVDPGAASCSGAVSPTSCTPTMVGDDYVWYFADGFTGSGQNAIIQLDVRKRCTGGGDLVATAYYDDLCNDDGTYDDTCSTVATETPVVQRSGDLLIEKTPEVYYATSNTLEWKVYVINRGTGTAYFVWVDDVLGAGLDYQSAVVDDMTGVTVTADQDHEGTAINGCTISISDMTPGERRAITLTALLVDCDNLTNDVATSWGCAGSDCQTPVSDNAIAQVPRPLLINTNVVTTPADACSAPSGYITLRNAGQTTCYNLQITETLPTGLTYVSGTTRWQINGGGWNGPNASYDPSPTTSPLRWTSVQISGLAESEPGDTIEIEYNLDAQCPFGGGDITLSTSYENPCGQVFTNADSVFTVAFRAPQITVSKTRVNEPIDCGQLVEWTITVQNTSGYTLPIIWVEDTLDAAFTYASSVGDPPYTSDNGTFDGVNKVSWELKEVDHNDTVTLTLRANTDSSPCSPDLDNTVLAWWGCGAADGSSGTKPGEDPPDDDLCLSTTSSSTVRTETREPSIGFLNISLDPSAINSCDDRSDLTVVIENPGPTDASDLDLIITLPAGLSYIAGSSAMCVGTDGSCATAAIGDPTVVGSQLRYYDIADKGNDLANLLQAKDGNDTLVLKFAVSSACFVTADLGFSVYYYDCCGDTQWNTTDSETLTALYPSLSLTKTPVNSQVDCDDMQEWTVTVSNNGSGDAEVVVVEDTLGDWIDYVDSTPAATPLGGQSYSWQINDLLIGQSQQFTIRGRLHPDAPQSDCTASLRQNTARTRWGCDSGCFSSTWVNATAATLQMPDLIVTTITPSISCTADGSFSGAISVTVRNQGDGVAYGGFQVSVEDGNGWSGAGSYGSDLAAGATTTVTIDVGTWNPDCSPCTYSFTTTVDSGDAVCECQEGNNDFGPQSYSPPIADLEVASDTLAISCTADGQYGISGTVTLRNAGCSGTLTQDVPMRFTLYSGSGCSGSQVSQWTQTFTGVSIAAGSTQTFTITSNTISGNACASSSSCQFSIFIEADYSDSICECDGTDNSLCSDKTFTIPDLRVDSDTLAISCNADGSISIQGNLVVANDGCGGDFTSNIPIRIRVYNDDDSCSGTSGLLTFTQGGVNIPAGGTQTFLVSRTLTRDLCSNSTNCQVTIGVELDYTGVICECDGSNNSYCSPNKSVSIPDLQVTSDTLALTCLQDGQVRVSGDVTIDNSGCNAAVTGNLPVRFTLFSNINCGGAQVAQWTETFAGANIAAGGSQVFSISNRDIITNICTNSTGCQVSLRIEADPAPSTICECSASNNTRCSNKTVSVPDLRITAVTPSITCTTDGILTGTVQVTVNNNGCGAADNMPVRLTSDCGYTFTDQTIVTLAAGSSTTLTYSFTPDIANCTCTFNAAVDPDNTICECDGSDNSLAAAAYTSSVPDLTFSDIDFSNLSCSNDDISDSVTVTVNNHGCGTASNFQVSLTTDGCLTFSNQTVASLAAGANTTLTFNVSGSWADCTDGSCQFTAEVDGPGVVCEYDGSNNTRSETYSSPLPDLVVSDIDFSGVTCSNDSIFGSVAVTIHNQGFGNAANFQVSLATDGCLTFSNQTVANLAAGSSTTLTFNVSGSWADCTDCSCQFTATVDAGNAVCECSGTNNTRSESYAFNLPNLTVTAVATDVVCLKDGNLVGTTVTVANTGCAAASNVVVRLTSDCGLTFADQTVDLAAGDSKDVLFYFISGITTCTCNFVATIDPENAICECNGSDNTRSSTQDMLIPDIEVQAQNLAVACLEDGMMRVAGSLTLVNNGCGPNLTAAVPMRFTLYGGPSCSGNVMAQWTETLTGVSLASGGGTQTFAIQLHDIAGNLCAASGCLVSLRVEADYGDTICEWDGTDNTLCTDIATACIDLELDSAITWTCHDDGTISFNFHVGNRGNTTASGVEVRAYDDAGQRVFSRRQDIAAGRSVGFAFDCGPYTQDQEHLFRFVVDEGREICECDGRNNNRQVTVSCQSPGAPLLQVEKICPTAEQPGGLYRFELEISNRGDNDALDVRVEDVLPDFFQYVAGSTVFDGQVIVDPGQNGKLIWQVGDIARQSDHTLVYLAIAPADMKPGRYCNEVQLFGMTFSGSQTASAKASCCFILRREAGQCCLLVEEVPLAAIQKPEQPISFSEPYFRTEAAMFAAYAGLHFFASTSLEDESQANFYRLRLKNYALSTIEEFLLHSRLGVTLPDGSLRLAMGGAFPQRDKKGWTGENADRFMSTSQLAFELLALNSAVKQEAESRKKGMLARLLKGKMDFIKAYISALPHRWKIGQERANAEKEKASSYDLATLFYALAELQVGGLADAASLCQSLQSQLADLDNAEWSTANIRPQLFYLLALLAKGEGARAKQMMECFEVLYSESKIELATLDLYALAVYADWKSGAAGYPRIFAAMQDKFYQAQLGIFAQPQSDLSQRIELSDLASLILAFESVMPQQADLFAVSCRRMLDEAGLFLNEKNLRSPRPPLPLLTNDQFGAEKLPILSISKGRKNMAPVFSENTVVYSTLHMPLSEDMFPASLAKVLSPGFEIQTSRIAFLSLALQYLGQALTTFDSPMTREQGRSLRECGRKYLNSLFESHSGMEVAGILVLPFESIAGKGSKEQIPDLEPLNSRNEFHTETLANFMIAERLYAELPGNLSARIGRALQFQEKIVAAFRANGFIPATFSLWLNDGEMVLLPGKEAARPITAAKLLYAAAGKELQQIVPAGNAALLPQDFVFLSLAPEALPLFTPSIQAFLKAQTKDFAAAAAAAIADSMLVKEQGKHARQLEKMWDRETELPEAARSEARENATIYHYNPDDIILYLLARRGTSDFRFYRSLNFFVSLLEKEWGLGNRPEQAMLPAADYWLLKENPRLQPEAGDLMTFRVRVWNQCPFPYGHARNFPAITIRAAFSPMLLYAATFPLEGLSVLEDFLWRYNGLNEGQMLEYFYQAFVPREFRESVIEGIVTLRGYVDPQEFGPDFTTGDYCVESHIIDHLEVNPLKPLPGLVFNDFNMNGIKDAAEAGIPGIIVRDSRGLLYRSDAAGLFTVLAGEEYVAVQLDLKSVPQDHLFGGQPTWLVNRYESGKITFALIPCATVSGFVFVDANGNERCDAGESRVSGVVLRAGEKESVSGANGEFVFRNLPLFWKDGLTVASEQRFLLQLPAGLRFFIFSEGKDN